MKPESPKPPDLLQFRERHGLTQKQAAEMAFSSLRSWVNWEHGCRRMHPAIWRHVRVAARTRERLMAAARM
jgi:DNA-binding XRE family transcriptional regulator